ncbi:hypothetical protein EDB83DRAFT_2314458 [Lactarius deliciosus]|nr:hypothetical protein EDB83DRAFT_2314458 [Lactarius deliciosus]
METAPPNQPGNTVPDKVPEIPHWAEPGIPPLESMYSHIWPRDMDTDYSESESDSSGSSEEWEGSSDSGLGSDSEEGSDSDDADGGELKLMVDQADMLQKHVAEFRAADLHCRLAIVKECLNWIQAGWQPKASFKRKEVETLVRHYLYNKGRRAKKSSTLNLGRRWTYRDIVSDVHHQELHTMTLSLSDSKGGSDKYLACYQKALKILQEGLSQETKEKMMQKYSMSTFREFTRYVYSQYGMWVAILGAYQDGEGDPSITLANRKGIGGSDDDGEKKSKDSTPEINLKTDSRGYPILPSWESVKDTEHQYKKYLIGKYMSEMYEMASEGRKVRIPWAWVREAQQDYVLDMYLPAGVTLTQFHHIRLGDANALLKHWTTRQAAGQTPFRFKKGDKNSRRSKAADIGTDNGDEADLNGIKNVQPEEDDSESQGGGKDSAAEDGAAEDPGPSRRPHDSQELPTPVAPLNASAGGKDSAAEDGAAEDPGPSRRPHDSQELPTPVAPPNASAEQEGK